MPPAPSTGGDTQREYLYAKVPCSQSFMYLVHPPPPPTIERPSLMLAELQDGGAVS